MKRLRVRLYKLFKSGIAFYTFHKYFRVADLPEKVDIDIYNFIYDGPEDVENYPEDRVKPLLKFINEHPKKDTMIKEVNKAIDVLMKEV